MSQELTIMVSAGEASGDAHAAHALQALEKHDIKLTSFGMGAGHLQELGTELIVDCRDLAVIGIVDVLLNYHKFLKRLKTLREKLVSQKPDLLLLVDYPDFNLKLAETAKKIGVPVLFYVSPQVWAWRANRVSRIGSLVSHMAVLFPFEVPIYEKANIPVTYVGNPVVADAVSSFSQSNAKAHFSLSTDKPVVALIPGSRHGEIKRHLSLMLQTARLLQKDSIDYQFIIPVAPTLDIESINQIVTETPLANIKVVTDDARHVMRAADVAFVASGTATLETALIGTPLVVMYRVSRINYAIMKRLITIPDVSLVNIVAGRRVVPEFIQDQAVPETMAKCLSRLITNKEERQTMLTELKKVKQLMGDAQASQRVAKLILDLTQPSKA